MEHEMSTETEKKYKWATPQEWLVDKAQTADETWLFEAVQSMAYRLDADSVQDIFQEDMSLDGYFEELKNDDKKV
jgi:hypothetical protein